MIVVQHLSPASGDHLVEILARQCAIAGRLRPGEKMPSQRELASEVVIKHLTVKRAYDELERTGQIESRRATSPSSPGARSAS